MLGIAANTGLALPYFKHAEIAQFDRMPGGDFIRQRVKQSLHNNSNIVL